MFKISFSLALVSILGFDALANDFIQGKDKIIRNNTTIYLDKTSKYKSSYESGILDKSIEAMKKAFFKNKMQTKGLAPDVSQVIILDVCSQQFKNYTGYDCEYILDNQTITGADHGGNPFFVITGVIGYGGSSTDSATYNGNQAVLLDIAGMDMNGDNIIDGWQEIWDISTPYNDSGRFVYTARSINSGLSMSTWIQIQ